MEENMVDTQRVSSGSLNLYIFLGIILVLIVCLFFSLEATNSNIELLKIRNSLSIGMTETQANYFWGSTPAVISRRDKTMLPNIPGNLLPQAGKLVRYSKISPSCYYLVHFDNNGKIDFLYFWLS